MQEIQWSDQAPSLDDGLGLRVVVSGEVVAAQVAVPGAVVQDVPCDHDEGVGDRDGCFAAAFLPESAVHAAELGTDVGAGPAGRPGTFGEDIADLCVCNSGGFCGGCGHAGCGNR